MQYKFSSLFFGNFQQTNVFKLLTLAHILYSFSLFVYTAITGTKSVYAHISTLKMATNVYLSSKKQALH